MKFSLVFVLLLMGASGCSRNREAVRMNSVQRQDEPRQRRPVDEEFAESEYVLIGTVVAATNILERGDFVRGTIYTVDVDETFKGPPPLKLLLYSENSSGRFPMQLRQKYFIFANHEKFEGLTEPYLAVNNRGNSALLRDATETIRQVREAESNRWRPANTAVVKAYLYNLAGEQGAPILKDGRLHPTIWNPKGVSLTEQQITKVRKAVAEYHPKAISLSARCYSPRHAIIYYNSAQEVVAFLEICFSCERYRASPEIPGPIDFEALKKIFVELRIPVFEDEHEDNYTKLK
jgi:hypothetical protein